MKDQSKTKEALIQELVSLRQRIIALEQSESEHQQAEKTLLEFEKLQRLVFEHSSDVIYTLDCDLRVTSVSNSVERHLGYRTEELVGRQFNDINVLAPESLEAAFKDALQTLTGGTVPTAEYVFIRKDGSRVIGEVSGSPLVEDGKIVGLISVARNITDRKWADEALWQIKRQQDALLNNIPDIAWLKDKESRFIAVNEPFGKSCGFKPEDLVGKTDLDIRPKELAEKYRSDDREVMESGKRKQVEEPLIDSEGKALWIETIKTPIYNDKGEVTGTAGIARDVTYRRRAEETLASEHDRLAAILDGIPIPAFMIDRNQIVILWNRNNEIFTGKTKDWVLGKRLDLGFLFKDKTSPTLAELVLEMTDEDLMRKYGSRGVHKSDVFPGAFESVGVIFPRGEERIMSIQAARIYNQQGEVIGAIQTAQDITDRVRIQEEHEKLQSQLIQAQKMEAIGTLAGGIAHDFNNILSGIMGYSELCLMALQDRPKVYHNIEQVLKAADRAKDLVRQILTFSRKTEQEKKPTALSPIIGEVVKFIRASLPATIEITQKIEETSDVIMADPSHLHQVLMNLCTNAGHAMKETGGVLEIGLQEVVINANDLLHRPPIRHGHYLVLTVSDTGRGIPEENLGRIFEPYFTTKEKGEGTGLGLAVVHGIVKDHGGEIRVYSEVGKETVFRVYLPLNEKQAEDGKDMEEAMVPGQGEKILFVDDEEMVANLSGGMLEELGYRVVTETDPVKAIEAFREDSDSFDLVITDKTMPHLTGFDVAREIKRIRADIPVMLASGFQEKGDLEKLTILGINRLISKPIRMKVLAKAIRDVVDKNIGIRQKIS